MNSKTLSPAYCRVFVSLVMTAIVLICVSSFSCQLSPEGITLLSGSYECPNLTDFSITGKNELQMTFSQEVEFTEMYIGSTQTTPEDFPQTAVQPENISITNLENGTFQYNLEFSECFDYGTSYVLYAVVEDSHGNSLSFSSGFTGYNENLPVIALSEVRTDVSKTKVEFVELYVLEEGNLGGLFLEVYYGTKRNTYAFPAADVHPGEYIVLHMRTAEGAVDETEDITVSAAADSCPQARDFWYPSESKTIGKTGVILLRERENGPLVDALLYAESEKESWPQEEMESAAQAAFSSGLWPDGADIQNAVCSDKCTATRTLSRQDFTEKGSQSWIVVATSSATPGAANSDKPAQ